MVKHESNGRVSLTKGEYEKMKRIIDGIKRRGAKKGDPSLTRAGDLDFTTKKGDKDFHRGGKDIKSKRKPFTKKK